MVSISKWNSKEADRYVTLKGGDVLCANRIGKKEHYYDKSRTTFIAAALMSS
jgi:hypothetical protein